MPTARQKTTQGKPLRVIGWDVKVMIEKKKKVSPVFSLSLLVCIIPWYMLL